ncbi:MAG TPA: carboxypeptidase regulatory-like domain-containing protein [Gemmatimonadales bacterium]|nr:carboxypeptidase regulatory-like domain-containing protein [Gemmatimonadales bacterium]
MRTLSVPFRAIALIFVAVAPLAAAAQEPSVRPTSGATISGRVMDSIAVAPLAEAMVQVMSADRQTTRSVMSDSAGAFAVPELPAGRYTIGFLHPVLEVLGVDAPLRQVDVNEGEQARIELAVPSASRVRTALCRRSDPADSTALFIGIVRDPRDGTAAAEASVVAQWLEVTFGTGGIQQGVRRITATTGPNGWFALCGLPPGTISVSVRRGTDSIPEMDLEVGPLELRRGDLYLNAPGNGRLRGKVVTADSARPLAGARVAVEGGPETQTNAQGEWALADVPLGTRMLEIRALGYYPDRRPVDVLTDPAAPNRVALHTFQAMLDAVRVTATRLTGEAALSGFSERQKGSGMGRFYDAKQIARRNPIVTSDLLRTMPGFRGDGSLMMKGNFSDGFGNFDVDCSAEVYVDGHLMRGISADELNGLVMPENIVAIETYSAGSPKPAQFESGMSGCGALVIWQKPMNERVRRRR